MGDEQTFSVISAMLVCIHIHITLHMLLLSLFLREREECVCVCVCLCASVLWPKSNQKCCFSHNLWKGNDSFASRCERYKFSFRGMRVAILILYICTHIYKLRIPTHKHKRVTWLILPVVICLSQRLSHACLRKSPRTANLRMAH